MYISTHCPALYNPHTSELTGSRDEKNSQLVEAGMQALAAVSQSDEALAFNDK
jgi:sister-chromatid-cohesion protein PDS5